MAVPARNAFIVLWLAVQFGLPLSYYLGDDRFDERFAWRMFSPVRIVTCQTRFFDQSAGGRSVVRAASEVHEVWGSLLTRARRGVIEGFARRWCDARRRPGAPAPVLTVDVTCTNPDTLNRTICRGANASMDADGDGVPDAYRTAPECADRDAITCFREACGARDAKTCRQDLCQVRPIPAELDLCEGG